MCLVRRSLLAVIVLAAGLAACSGGGGTETVLLGAVEVDAGNVVLGSGCWERLDARAELIGDQIVVQEMAASGRIEGDCLSTTRTELAAGPDVVHADAQARWAIVGNAYRQVDYCGVDTRRCVPFSPDSVPPSCAEESLRFATLGMYDGVYPFEVLRCEGRWALVDLDTCGGYHGEDGPYCAGYGVDRILLAVTDGTWNSTGFKQDLFCPNPAEYDPELPDWVCEAA